MLIDHIDGKRDVRYRRYKADWLEVLPSDDDDEEAHECCKPYVVAIAPAPRT